MPERTVEIPSKTIGALILLLLSMLVSMVVYVWNHHMEEYEEMKRIVDVIGGGNPYRGGP